MNYMRGMPDLRICLRLHAHSKSIAFGKGTILCSMWIGLVCAGGIRTPGEMCSTWTGRITREKGSTGCTLTDRLVYCITGLHDQLEVDQEPGPVTLCPCVVARFLGRGCCMESDDAFLSLFFLIFFFAPVLLHFSCFLVLKQCVRVSMPGLLHGCSDGCT